MAGLYIHIPFCKQACSYCNFHFSISPKLYEAMMEALIVEISLSKNYLQNRHLQTVYFGGGTPSLIRYDDLERIFEAINSNYKLTTDAEVTLEANPDDLTKQKLAELKSSPVNRLSIGIQSFHKQDLELMNRAHSAPEGQDSIKRAQDAGFENLTIDMIYGSPATTNAMWAENLKVALDLNIPHISSYCLTIEPRTALARKMITIDDPQADEQFQMLMDMLGTAGYEHYEISNFALPGKYAVHNTNYWKGIPYLGIGPSAHSYNGISRQWNVANNAKYIKAIQAGAIPAEVEELTLEDRFNEYIMTSLRTMWGCDLEKVKIAFGEDVMVTMMADVQAHLDTGNVARQGKSLVLTKKGKSFADRIASDLFR